jgi:DNA-binding NarL/FixJ family response regulator
MNSAARPTCVIADDHRMFRQAIRSLLEKEGFEIVGEADNGHEAVKLVTRHSPQLALLDYGMPMLNGSFAAAEILKRSPDTQVVLLTMYDDETFALDAVRSGVRGYVLKEQAAQELVAALRQVLSGSIYLSPNISESVVIALLSKKEQPSDLLTPREKQVLQLIAEGKTTKDIASVLHLSVKTAESHRSNIMNRLNVHNVASLVRYAIRHGMIEA